jgi:hypothetical protein
MTVNGPAGIVHLFKDRIVVYANNGAIYPLSRDGQVLARQSHVSSISARDESEVLCKQETRHSDKVVHEWTFVKGEQLEIEKLRQSGKGVDQINGVGKKNKRKDDYHDCAKSKGAG